MNTKLNSPVSFQRILLDAILLSLAIGAVCAVVALKVYNGNVSDFGFPLQDLFIPFIYAVGFLSLFFVAVLFVFWKTPIYRRIAAFFFTITLLFWIQSNFLVWRYGLLNARDIDWNRFLAERYIEISIWLIGISLGFFFYRKIYGQIFYVLLLLVLLQGIDAWTITRKAPPPDYDKFFVSEDSSKYEFSAKKNVIIIVLDSFQGSFFNEIIESTPEYADIFNGFTFYKNALCAIPSSKLSLVDILAGVAYDNTVPVHQYQRKRLLAQSLPLRMRKIGFATEYYNIIGYDILPLDNRLWSNVRRATTLVERSSEYLKLIQTTAFRLLPQIGKERLYKNGNWELADAMSSALNRILAKLKFGDKEIDEPKPSRVSIDAGPIRSFINFPPGKNQDIDFINRALNFIRAENIENRFKVFHLLGLHPIRNYDEKLRFDPSLHDNLNEMLRCGRGSIKLMSLFLDKLKELGIYESSIIVIVGDHGSGYLVDSLDGLTNRELRSNSLRLNFSSIKGYAIPLILVKPPYSDGKLKVSNSPVALGDVPNTIMDALGETKDFPGKSMFLAQETDRKRFFWIHAFDMSSVDYYGDLHEFIISGDVYQDRSWRMSGRLLKPKETDLLRTKKERDDYLRALVPLKPIEGGLAFAEPAFSFSNGSFSADRAFDKTWRTTGWLPVDSSGNLTTKAILGIHLRNPEIVKAYSLRTRYDLQYQAPKTWVFQASEDGQIWIDLDAVKNEISWEPDGKVKVFKIKNINEYLYYRIKIDEAQDVRGVFIDEFELFK